MLVPILVRGRGITPVCCLTRGQSQSESRGLHGEGGLVFAYGERDQRAGVELRDRDSVVAAIREKVHLANSMQIISWLMKRYYHQLTAEHSFCHSEGWIWLNWAYCKPYSEY